MSKWIVPAVVVAAVATGGWLLFGQNGSAAPAAVRFRTAKVERGEIVEGVQASGTVQPVILVQVGTQVSGVIEKLLVDFNSKVKAGQTIAVLDMRRLESQVAQDVASVARAKAEVERVRATVAEAKSELRRTQAASGQVAADVDRVNALLTQAERNLERQTALSERKLISASDLDAAVASRNSLQAQLASAKASVELNAAQVTSAESTIQQDEAQLLVSQAAVRQAEAQEQGDRVNLGYATIVSPIDGVVVSRNVDVGQTVAASLSAPTLFVIANDLTRIQIQTSVPEADIGRLHDGQKVVFNVDAHPDKSFDGVVSQVRLASTTVQNVVTYTVLVEASNPDGLLLPGMTANVTFEIQRSAKDAMTVPASALRLQATPDLLESPEQPAAAADAPAADAPRVDGAGAGDGKPAGGPGQGGPRRGKGAGKRTRGVVYLQTPAGKLRGVPVKLGISDGIRTVVEASDAAALAEGAEVVTAVMRDDGPATTNPFAPPRMSTSTRPTGAR
jgi:HlyD family secretion protein